MNNSNIYYSNGIELKKGDKVLVNDKKIASVEVVFSPHTSEALTYCCKEGGFLLSFEDGDCQAWCNTDEDIIFLSRGEI